MLGSPSIKLVFKKILINILTDIFCQLYLSNENFHNIFVYEVLISLQGFKK